MATVTPGNASLVLTGRAAVAQVVLQKAPSVDTLAVAGTVPTIWITAPFITDESLPGVIATGTAYFGTTFSADAELAPLEGEVGFGWEVNGELAAVFATGTLAVGRVFAALGVLPALQGEAEADLGRPFSADLSLPSVLGSGTALFGRTFSLDQNLSVVTGTGAFAKTTPFSGTLQIPTIEIDDSVLLVGALFSSSADISTLVAAAEFVDETVLSYYAFSTSAFNLAHGPYSNVEFDGFGRLGNNSYVAMSDGLYRLDGDDDNGTAIEAYFLHGFEDFGNEAVKTQRVVYIGLTADGPMQLLARTDTDGRPLFEYPVEDPHTAAEGDAPTRVKLGRGLKGRYWQLGIRNLNGADFHIDRLGLGVWTSTRKR